MLQIELYEGTSAGSLTLKGNKTDYLYVTAGPYQRRSDLKNPSALLDRLIVEGIGL